MTTSTITPPSLDKMVFRKTNSRLGRVVSVTPENSTNKHLCYGRIILNAKHNSVSFANQDHETGLIVLSGAASVETVGKSIDLNQYDAVYVPRDSNIKVSTDSSVDIAEFSAEVSRRYPLQIVRFEELKKDPGLYFSTGTGTSATRQLHMSLAKNITAGRILAGFTFSDPGNWTSWPPHEHAKMLEEMYVYFNMPDPAFGIQLVYNDTEYPELVTVVRDGDAVLMPGGYHPNVSVPGHRICFLWAMAAHREVEDHQFGLVNVQPGFDKGRTGLESGRAQK